MQHICACGEARFAGRGPQSREDVSCEGERANRVTDDYNTTGNLRTRSVVAHDGLTLVA